MQLRYEQNGSPPSTPPEDKILGAAEMRNGIQRLQKRIQELKELKVGTISSHRSPEIVGLETQMEDTLAAIFGHGTPKFKRYRSAADLEPPQSYSMTPDFMAVRGGYTGPSGADVQELQQGIVQRTQQAISILEQVERDHQKAWRSQQHSNLQTHGIEIRYSIAANSEVPVGLPRTGYSSATPSGSFSANHSSAAS